MFANRARLRIVQGFPDTVFGAAARGGSEPARPHLLLDTPKLVDDVGSKILEHG